MKKLLALVLALVMTLSLAVVGSNAAFKDAKDVNETYSEAVDVLSGMGVFNGYKNADGTYSFQPKGDITRAEVAAIVYRLYTADVTDKQASLYATYNKFSDMNGAAWAAGYIGYCANAGLIKGYDAKTFGPSDKVTGYQALAMILRAVGYDKNGEFTGADWQLHVAQTAQQLGILKNVKGVDLNAAASRELVAELLFRTAAEVPTVTYTAALGYSNMSALIGGTKNATLGYKNFGLTKVDDTDDMWGRPAYSWTNGKTGTAKVTYATITATPDKTYTTFTKECDIASDMGIKTHKVYTVLTNGADNKSTYDVVSTDTVYGIGAQGQLVEVYDEYNRIVVIDTYLAKVTTVVAERADAAGHVITPAANGLAVYTGVNSTTGAATTTAYSISGNNYTVGQYILVSVVEKNGAFVATKYEDKGLAETLVGGQTILFSNLKQHVVEGTTYNDACKFYLNEAGNETINHTWYLDAYGNLIGATDISTVYSYGTIKDIQWINPVGANGYAQATIVLMDGTEQTMKVKNIMNGSTNNLLAYAQDNNRVTVPYVSTNMALNYDEYAGKHLYQIATNSDETVTLSMVESISTPKAIGDELNLADVKTGVSAITGTEGNIYTNANTQYLVRVATSVAGVYTFQTATGYDKIGNYTGTDVVVDYVDADNNGFAEYVYIIGTPDSATSAGLFYLTDSNVKTVLASNVVDYYELTGIVDGTAGTIKTKDATVVTAILNAGVGKMNIVNYSNGYVVAAAGNSYGLTNYQTLAALGGNYADKAISSYFLTPNTINAEGVTANVTAVYEGGVLKVTKGSTVTAYNMASATVLNGTLAEGAITDKAIYVVYGLRNTAGEYIASAVYVTDYVRQNQGAGTITNDWVNDSANGNPFQYSQSLMEIAPLTAAATLGQLQTAYGTVLYSAPNSANTYVLTAYDNMTNLTVSTALAAGYTVQVSNAYGLWTVVSK